MNPQQLADFTKAELARWAQVVKTSKIEADLKRHFVANPAGAGLQHRAIQRGALP
jgi:hypothetical protein